MAATEPLYLRLAPGLKDRIVAAARRDGVSANEWASEHLRRALADPVGAATRRERPPEAEPLGHGAEETEGPRRAKESVASAGSASAPDSSAFVPDALKPKPAETAESVAKGLAASVEGVGFAQDLVKEARPFGKQDQAGPKR